MSAEGKVTFDRLFVFMRVYLTFVCCWPLPVNATKFQRLRRSVLRFLCVTNTALFIVALVWTLTKHSDDFLLVMKVGCELSTILQVPLQIILFAMQDHRLQLIVLEMETYYQRAQKYERDIFQHYVDKCKLLYGTIFVWLAATAAYMILAPTFLSQPFPCDAEYPFDALQQPLRTVIYVHQIFLCCQSVFQVSANGFSALILWFIVARFDILSAKFRTATDFKELTKCTREHYELLKFSEEVTLAIRYIALLCVTFSTGAVMFGCLTFMSQFPWFVKCPFLMIALSGFVELYMYAWPTDNVMSMSSDIATAAYDSLWYNRDPATQRILIYVILRSQRPVTISIPCALPNLSMNYYASLFSKCYKEKYRMNSHIYMTIYAFDFFQYISSVFSYMTLVRIIMNEE